MDVGVDHFQPREMLALGQRVQRLRTGLLGDPKMLKPRPFSAICAKDIASTDGSGGECWTGAGSALAVVGNTLVVARPTIGELSLMRLASRPRRCAQGPSSRKRQYWQVAFMLSVFRGTVLFLRAFSSWHVPLRCR